MVVGRVIVRVLETWKKNCLDGVTKKVFGSDEIYTPVLLKNFSEFNP